MTELVLSHHRTVALPSASEAQRLWTLSTQVQGTDMVPEAFRGKPEAVLACALAGREIGLGFFEALRSFYVVDGKPSESAELLHTLALRGGHDVRVEVSDRTRCLVRARNRAWPADRGDLEIEWTIADAAAAELMDWTCVDSIDATGRHAIREIQKHGRNGPYTKRGCDCKDNWRAYTRAMLRSRAISEAVRAVCPEVTVGATYTAEELGAAVEGPGGRPVGAAHGWGAAGDDPLELPALEDVDQTWVAEHDETTVLALVDHYGPDAIVEGAGEVRLVEWVRRLERTRGEAKRPRLLDALDARDDQIAPDPAAEEDPEIEDAEIVDPDEDDDEGGTETTDPEPEPQDDGPTDDPAVAEPTVEEDPTDEPTPAEAAPVDLAEIPDPTVESARYGAWLAAAADAYRELNVTEVSTLIRRGHVDLDGGRRFVIPDGRPGLELVARFEKHSPGAFRRTVRGALESAGLPKTVRVPESAPEAAQDAPAEPDGPDAPEEPSTPESGSEDLEGRRAALRRWKAAHRELSAIEGAAAEEAARRCLASRMNAGAAEDRAWAELDVEVLADLVAEVETARAENLPF